MKIRNQTPETRSCSNLPQELMYLGAVVLGMGGAHALRS